MQEKHELGLKLQAKVGVEMVAALKIQVQVGVETALVGELEAVRETVRLKEEEERLKEEREAEK